MGKAPLGKVLLDDDLMVSHLDLCARRKGASRGTWVRVRDRSPKDRSGGGGRHGGIVGSHSARTTGVARDGKLEQRVSDHRIGERDFEKSAGGGEHERTRRREEEGSRVEREGECSVFVLGRVLSKGFGLVPGASRWANLSGITLSCELPANRIERRPWLGCPVSSLSGVAESWSVERGVSLSRYGSTARRGLHLGIESIWCTEVLWSLYYESHGLVGSVDPEKVPGRSRGRDHESFSHKDGQLSLDL